MPSYSLSHLADSTLLHELRTLVAKDRATTAELLAHIAEVDARRLYAPAGYPSMFAYCVQELGLSEDAAYKRIQAARAARQFPAIFPAVAAGQLHLAAVCLLAPHLTPGNATELLRAAAGKPKSEIEEWLARRFPRSELLPLVESLPASASDELAPGQVGSPAPGRARVAPDVVAQLAPGQVGGSRPSRVIPVAPARYALHLTIGQETRDKLRYAQELLGHVIPSGEVPEVFDRALDALIAQLERGKFAATSRPRGHAGARPVRSGTNPRHIPAAMKRAVWERDGGRCTFVSATGNRCAARTRLEYDHADPVARGGTATVAGLRLRCRTHNQYAAECAFGAGFMEHKRTEARQAARARAQVAAETRQLADRRKQAAAEVIPWLRSLGFRADEALRAAALAESIPDASLEERVRLALTCFAKHAHGTTGRAPESGVLQPG